jgi:hypothetical protein
MPRVDIAIVTARPHPGAALRTAARAEARVARQEARRDVGLWSHSVPMGLKVLDRRTIKCAVDDAG